MIFPSPHQTESVTVVVMPFMCDYRLGHLGNIGSEPRYDSLLVPMY